LIREEFLNKKADVVYKKLVLLLATTRGSGSLAISHEIYWLFVAFLFLVMVYYKIIKS